MMIVLFLLVFCALNTDGLKEGDYCIKEGLMGACINIRNCPAAQQDIKDKKRPQLCEFSGSDPTVCCVSSGTTITQRPQNRRCVLPPYPESGTYSANVANGRPGEAYDIVVINITCNHGYKLDGHKTIFCQDGWWLEQMPKCVQCGTIASHGTQLKRSVTARAGDLPWHVTIYSKTSTRYKQHCAGTLVSSNAVISVAHCFWNRLTDSVLPASDFAVAAGKLHRFWEVTESHAQTSDVSEIHIPVRFRSDATNFQDDISVLKLATAILVNSVVQPVCLSFDSSLERSQLAPGNLGKIPSWSAPTSASGPVGNTLLVSEVSFTDLAQCFEQAPRYFLKYITSDKFCAISDDASSQVCRGRWGAALAFPSVEGGVPRYYIRGVASTSPPRSDDGLCSQFLTFTQLSKHEDFIKAHL